MDSECVFIDITFIELRLQRAKTKKVLNFSHIMSRPAHVVRNMIDMWNDSNGWEQEARLENVWTVY